MSKWGGVLVVVLSLVAGFGGGWAYDYWMPGNTNKAADVSASASPSASASTKTLAECLTEVWGEDKYAAITANANLATTADNFAALACYETK